MLSASALVLLRDACIVANVGAFAFLATLEGGHGAGGASSRRWQHLLPNLLLFVLLFVSVDVLLLGWWLGTPATLNRSAGLLTPLDLPPAVQFLVGFVVADLVAYLFHRLAHRWRWLWLLHCVHHSDPRVDVSTSVRFHPLEVAIDFVLTAAVLLALGIPLWVQGASAAVNNPLLFLQHADLALPAAVERTLGRVLVLPSMHKLHHSTERVETDSNYGVFFSFWDRLFGTYRAPTGPRPARFGLVALEGARWQSVAGMLLTPLRARRLASF